MAAAAIPSKTKPELFCFTEEQRGQLAKISKIVEVNFRRFLRCLREAYLDGSRYKVSYLQYSQEEGAFIVLKLEAFDFCVIKVCASLPCIQRREQKYEEAEKVIQENALDRISLPEYQFGKHEPLLHDPGYGWVIEKNIGNSTTFLGELNRWEALLDETAMKQLIAYVVEAKYPDVKPGNIFPKGVGEGDERACYLAFVDPDCIEKDREAGLFGSTKGYMGLTMCSPERMLSVIEVETTKAEVFNQELFHEVRGRREKIIGIQKRQSEKIYQPDDWSNSTTALGQRIFSITQSKNYAPGLPQLVPYSYKELDADRLALKITSIQILDAVRREIAKRVFQDRPNSCIIFFLSPVGDVGLYAIF